MLAVGTIAFCSLQTFGASASRETGLALEETAKQTLINGSRNDRYLLNEFIKRVENDTIRQANSSSLLSLSDGSGG